MSSTNNEKKDSPQVALQKEKTDGVPSVVDVSQNKKVEDKKVEKVVEEVLFVPKRKISYSQDYKYSEGREVTLREFDNFHIQNGAWLINALGAQEGSIPLKHIVSQFLVKQLSLPLIGDIISDAFEPLCSVTHGIPSNGCRIYGDKDLVIFESEYKFGPFFENVLTDIMFDFSTRHKCEAILAVSSIIPLDDKAKSDATSNLTSADEPVIEQQTDEAKTKEEFMKMVENKRENQGKQKKLVNKSLYFLTNSEKYAKELLAHEHKPMHEVNIPGINGKLIVESTYREDDINVVGLFCQVPKDSVDVHGVIALTHALDGLMGKTQKINYTELDKDLSDIENQIIEIVKQMSEPVPQSPKPLSSSTMYL